MVSWGIFWPSASRVLAKRYETRGEAHKQSEGPLSVLWHNPSFFRQVFEFKFLIEKFHMRETYLF